MASIFEAIGRFAVRFKYPVVVAWIAIAIFSVAVFPPLSSVTKDNNSGFLPSSAASMQASHLASVFQNNDLVNAENRGQSAVLSRTLQGSRVGPPATVP